MPAARPSRRSRLSDLLRPDWYGQTWRSRGGSSRSLKTTSPDWDAASSATNRAVARTEVLRVASSAAEVSAASGSVIVPLSRHSLLVDYGTSMKAYSEPQASDVPVLRMGNVKHGRLDWSSLKYIPPDAPDLPRLLLRDGDLLFNRTNSAEHVGKSAVYLGREPTKFRVIPDPSAF